jgi:hypothetical protein
MRYLGLSSKTTVVKMPEPYAVPTVPIQVTLSESSAKSNLGSATVHVTLTNLSPHTISLLRWSSPLDARAIAMGAVRFISTTTNKTAPYLNIKINRKMPESGYFSVEDEWITTIPPSGTAQKELKAGEPEVALTKGEKYRVVAQGRWMGVWRRENEQEEVSTLRLDDALTGDFESNEIEIEIPSGEEGEL